MQTKKNFHKKHALVQLAALRPAPLQHFPCLDKNVFSFPFFSHSAGSVNASSEKHLSQLNLFAFSREREKKTNWPQRFAFTMGGNGDGNNNNFKVKMLTSFHFSRWNDIDPNSTKSGWMDGICHDCTWIQNIFTTRRCVISFSLSLSLNLLYNFNIDRPVRSIFFFVVFCFYP